MQLHPLSGRPVRLASHACPCGGCAFCDAAQRAGYFVYWYEGREGEDPWLPPMLGMVLDYGWLVLLCRSGSMLPPEELVLAVHVLDGSNLRDE